MFRINQSNTKSKRQAPICIADLTFIFFYNICSVLNYLLPLYVIVDSWENAYLEHTALQTILNQLLFFTMCDLIFCTHARGNPFGLTGLNSLLFYYIITFFIKRVLDIFTSFQTTQNANQNKHKSLILCILKIIIEWAKALIIILCLKEQGLQPHPNLIYTLVTFIYYVCTEAVFIELFPKILNYFDVENLEGLENLYAPVILNCCSLSLSIILSTFLYLKGYNRLATFIFYHSIILNYKGAKSKCWQKLKEEKDILKTFRHATKKEIEKWNDICPICLQKMERARVTKCSHLFHAECLRKCCKVTNSCPLCKTELRNIPNNSRNEIDVQ